jgi:hypothetical protein
MLRFIIKLLAILSVFLLVTVGCNKDNPVESEEEHFEAIGLFIISSGDTIVTYQGGVVSGEIEVEEGTLTALLSVKFITDDGDVGIPPSDDWSLDWSIADTTYAQLVGHDDEVVQYIFHISGKKAGTTSITIIINHHDHKDFESKEIPIHVAPGGGAKL